jgi:hypothetical protein
MLAHDSRLIALLPTVGLCSCVVSSEARTVDPGDLPTLGLIEQAPERQPLTVGQALIRSGRESLAAGHYAAAYASLSLAMAEYPNESMLVTMDTLDAALGIGNLTAARHLIDEIRRKSPTLQSQLSIRIVRLQEIENSRGLGPCEANIDEHRRPLLRTSDPLAAWNELRSGLPADRPIPIPIDEDAAWRTVCSGGCNIGEPSFARLEGDNETTIALVVRHDDGSLSVLADLLHLEHSDCFDQTMLAVDRHDGLVRIRAFLDRRGPVDPDDSVEEYYSQGPAGVAGSGYSYAYASSGYQSSGYQSSGYQSSGYNYGYAYASACGGGHDDYGYGYTVCEVHAHVERDVILDLDRGEVVLDIVRTGDRGSALGHVSIDRAPAGAIVDVQACGERRSLQLHYT